MGKHATIPASGACTASIDFDSALAILAAHALPLGKESIPLRGAGGRYLAAPVLARIDAPRRDCAAMDGYAVRDADLKNGTIVLRSRGTSYAGGAEPGAISAGETWRVMTGGPMPHGSDRVVMIEHCRHRRDLVVLDAPPLVKPHVRKAGSDFAAGDELLTVGTRMTAARLVVAAAADHSEIEVWRRPRILLVATGDEILAPGCASRMLNAIPDSLSIAIEHLCASAGADVVTALRLADNERAIADALETASADVVVVIGGASRGDRDFGRSAFASLGLDIAFADVAIKPGKPVWYGRLGQTHVLGLPGNPTAAFTVASLFLAPLIAGLSGGPIPDAPPWQLRHATRSIPQNGPREAFLCATFSCEGAAICDRQDASGQAMLGLADCLVRRPANAPPADVGDLLLVLPLC
ncbi:MAG: molybdopterin molybdotransferase MoeA [Sphingopyxis sp.]|uniref:molybdopterin molybdotransferase MoeA n=1 Tax=Sphingopyxis sp. TaxID=1908224 RepID=UPI001A4DE000|nr:molybdopterin molybdotransferase MoeA [Sphingopyxis sp.]MBL9065333.1 molybdopterin molybdotransferase MoeA [Sphingopyxis sp.]